MTYSTIDPPCKDSLTEIVLRRRKKSYVFQDTGDEPTMNDSAIISINSYKNVNNRTLTKISKKIIGLFLI